MNVKELFLSVCDQALSKQDSDNGLMPQGHNGPYYDTETPVRNTAHWVISFFTAYDLTHCEKYHTAAIKCGDYLMHNCTYRTEFNYRQRVSPLKDDCNGLIGPAWVMESLYKAFSKTKEVKYLHECYRIYSIHPFNKKIGLWKIVTSAGTVLNYDLTFNHQLWFYMASLSLLKHYPQMSLNLSIFAKKMNRYFKISRSGRIQHLIQLTFADKLKNCVKNIVRPADRNAQVLKEVGYQTFNLYALNSIAKSLSRESLKKINHARSFVTSNVYARSIGQSEYGFGYNAPGFEIPYIFIADQDFSRSWIEKQLDQTFNQETYSFNQNTADEITLTARVYEWSRWIGQYADFTI